MQVRDTRAKTQPVTSKSLSFSIDARLKVNRIGVCLCVGSFILQVFALQSDCTICLISHFYGKMERTFFLVLTLNFSKRA